MIWTLLGVLIGIILGLTIDISIPTPYIKYTAVIIIVILDSLFGAAKAEINREEEDYNPTLFISGLLFNVILALGITLLGERLGLDLYLAVTVVFTFRIFSNLGPLRRAFLKKIKKIKN